MAESALAFELADSLSQDDIPIKLRCASCNKLVVNAFRLPCCDQSVCEPCQQNLPNECPVCAHSPLSVDDCKPNKALRLTVKAFLKNEEKKRDKGRETSNSVSNHASKGQDAPQDQDASILQQDETGNAAEIKADPEQSSSWPLVTPNVAGDDDIKVSIETPEAREETPQASKDDKSEQHAEEAVLGENGQYADHRAEGENEGQTPGEHQPNRETFETNTPSSGWNTGFNPMMAMPNGMMNPVNFSGFPNMMGMPSMGMDSMMMSQGMFRGFNGVPMGMNGMNMALGFDGNMGGWANQAPMGMMSGDFGTNTAFFSGGGYSHQQSNHMHNQQFSNEKYPQNRLHRGRGYFQRGNYGRDYGRTQNYNHPHGRNQQPRPYRGFENNGDSGYNNSSSGEADATQKLEGPTGGDADAPDEAQNVQDVQKADEGSFETQGGLVSQEVNNNTDTHATEGPGESREGQSPGVEKSVDSPQPLNNEYSAQQDDEDDITLKAPQGPAAQFASGQGPGFFPRGRAGYRGNQRGGLRGRGGTFMGGSGFHQEPTTTLQMGPGVVGAPTGPKAMRDGSGNMGIRGRGSFRGGRNIPPGPAVGPSSQQAQQQSQPTSGQPDGIDEISHEHSIRSRSRTISRSPRRGEQESRRSRSPGKRYRDDEHDRFREDRRDPHKHEHLDSSYAKGELDTSHDYVGDKSIVTQREEYGDETHLHSRRSKDKYRSFRRDQERSRSRSPDHKHRRHRSRSPQRESRRNRDRSDREREYRKRSRREKSYSTDDGENQDASISHSRRNRRHHSSRSKQHQVEEIFDTARPREFTIAGRSRMQAASRSEKPGPSTTETPVDPYLNERLQRDKERMAKEQESRGTAGNGRSDRKRGLGDGIGTNGDDGYSGQRRRLSYFDDEHIASERNGRRRR